jgi:hypothetical protein
MKTLVFVAVLALLSVDFAYSQVDYKGIILPEVQQKLIQLNQEWYASNPPHTGQLNLD